MSLTWQDETGRKRKPLAGAPLFDPAPLGVAKVPKESQGEPSLALNPCNEMRSKHIAARSQGEQARARRNDPTTSHAAAKSVSLENLGRTKNQILRILRDKGPLTDEQLIVEHTERVCKFSNWHPASPSGIRTRRSWLVDHGFVEQAGFSTTAAGRPCQVWRVKK